MVLVFLLTQKLNDENSNLISLSNSQEMPLKGDHTFCSLQISDMNTLDDLGAKDMTINLSSTKAELQRTSLYWSTTLVDLFSLIWKYSQRAIHINMHKSPMHVNQMACWNRPFCVGLYVLIKMIKKVVKCLFNRLNRFWMQFMCFENLRTQTFLAPAYASSNAECSICFANRLLDTALDLLCI